jgi:dienelactone hydrolase
MCCSMSPSNTLAKRVALWLGCVGLYATLGPRKGLLAARHQAMADMLNAWGYHAVFPDSFTPRGLPSICAIPTGQRSVSMRERRRDVLATHAWVRGQAWADPAKVALLGWSNGGSSVLAATDAGQGEVQAAGATFATSIAFYPGCEAALKAATAPTPHSPCS